MVSRRSVLRGAGGLAAALPLSAAPAARASASPATPPHADDTATPATTGGAGTVAATVRAARGPLGGGQVITPELTPTHLVVSGPAQVRLRTADGWQPWRPASGCPGGPDHPGAEPRALVPAAGAVEYQVRRSDGAPVEVTELNTVAGPVRATAAPVAPLLPLPRAAGCAWRPRYLSRAAWGADESYRYNPDGTLDTPPAFYGVQTLTVHHSGEDDPEPDPIAHIRGIYYNQAVAMDWGDIGYQLLIDADGRVYEGTYSDPDRIPVFGPQRGPDGHPLMVNGAHVGGFNAGNIGICLLGNYMVTPPSAASLRSLTVVLALLASATGLDPLGTTRYVNPVSGATATIATIAGHQDWHTANPAAGATLCPGDQLYARLPQLRQRVAAVVRAF
ncbi:N-acetylmuramoyl-L-alanine amidase [Krasilnikovia cinnamomea]|uniref:N-acetylmuramoyl-L-alanine amidase n=1 Tax=Krasilnikovia cinnamomea TaxID=349313 RepID=A0A4Q7ZEJ9_9ACTN|nr:peptidoglycan recognition family protein [Krasilnikovia cinnamomea]RZU48379.1 N-acetylmuramoyl-L-alanine amidase [Krasilnikovia cinnamomea]